jgi:RNA-directed DNA polymerase
VGEGSTRQVLRYTFGRMHERTTGRAYPGVRPSKKRVRRMVETVRALTARETTWQETIQVVRELNRSLRGWAPYFKVGTVRPANRALDNCTAVR